MALLALALFGVIFCVVLAVVAAGRRILANKSQQQQQQRTPASESPSSEADYYASSSSASSRSADDDDGFEFDWLMPVNAGIISGETLSTISVWDQLLARFDGIEIMKQRLTQAGMQWSVGRLTSMMMLAGAATFAILWKMSWASTYAVLAVSCAAASGPYLMVLRRRAKRLAKIEEQFPDALDSLARAVRAGNSLAAALDLLARESPQPLAGELRRAANQRSLGSNWEVALENLAERLPVPEVSVFVGALQLQSRSGGKLHEVLGKLAETMRESSALKGEIRAISAHGKLTGAILTGLPVVIGFMMAYVNPPQMLMLWTDPLGNKLIWAALFCLVLAHVVIRKLVTIKL